MANLVRYGQPALTPWGEAVDRLFRDSFAWPRLFDEEGLRNSRFGMSSNLYETDDAYVMQVVLPGLQADEMQITAQRNVLSLRGKTGVAVPEGARGIWVGLGGGEFNQQVTLPGEVDGEKATAEYSDGILTLTLPKAERTRARTIKVSTPASAQPAIEGEK